MKPRRVKDLQPAKNGDKLGVANPKNKQFFVLDPALLNVWLLCDGKRSEEEVSRDLIKLFKDNTSAKLQSDINEKQVLDDVKLIIKRLMKYGLLE